MGFDRKEDLRSDFKGKERSNEAWEPTEDAWKKARTMIQGRHGCAMKTEASHRQHGRVSLGPAQRSGFSAFIRSSSLFLEGVVRVHSSFSWGDF